MNYLNARAHLHGQRASCPHACEQMLSQVANRLGESSEAASQHAQLTTPSAGGTLEHILNRCSRKTETDSDVLLLSA